jgi:hypothetical protein
MPTASTQRDPRSIVTPEAFHVSQELMGRPLASPRRRLAAILLDVVFIGILTAVTRSFALLLGIVVAVALVRAGFKRTPVRGSVFDRARRVAVGCLGLWVGFVTLLIGAAILIDDGGGDDSRFVVDLGSAAVSIEPDAPADELVEPRDALAIREGVSLYSTEEALEAYAALLRDGADTETDRVLGAALAARLADEVAADTLTALRERVADLEDELVFTELQLQEAEEELDEDSAGGVLGWLIDIVDELGFGFGWAAVYATVLLSATNGQTLGKRLLGIRVIRLDGQPINWWVAFERAGGYAAGFATGLLGFAQVYWDANRQGIHDRIVGTVVVREGAERVSDWESAV